MECSLRKNSSLGFQCSISEMEKFFFSAMLDILPLFIYVFLSRAPDLLLYLRFCMFDLFPLASSQVRQVDICINNHTDEDDKRGILTHTQLQDQHSEKKLQDQNSNQDPKKVMETGIINKQHIVNIQYSNTDKGNTNFNRIQALRLAK